ncbi:MAG: threonine aldolase family protein, partial [Alphaproteobacteria bacterium]
FGATKNGALAAEAVIFFDPARAEGFAYRRKRAGHLLSKSRFLAAQWDAYLADDLWLRLAKRANGAAHMLAEGLRALPGVRFHWPVEANEVFAELPPGAEEALERAGARFHPWAVPGDPAGGRMVRMVTSFATQQDEVRNLLDILQAHKEKPVS